MQHFKKLFETLSQQEKSDYQLEILENKPKQKKAFIEKYKDKLEKIRLEDYQSQNTDELLSEIYAEADDLKNELDSLDFEETNWERWHEPDHYVPEWEAAQEIAEEEAMDIVEPY
jgi:hypothetical protein